MLKSEDIVSNDVESEIEVFEESPKQEEVKDILEVVDHEDCLESPEKQFLEKIEQKVDQASLDTLMEVSAGQDTVSEQ